MSRVRALAVVLMLLASCEREDRRLDSREFTTRYATWSDSSKGPYDHNAHGTTEGQMLFEQMNCSGCHANGGGGMGPALMDDKWIYGSNPNEIFTSIASGRPNGMPAWKSRLNNEQIWRLVAYVRSLSGLTPKGDRPSREDHMMVKPSPYQTPKAKPVIVRSTFTPAGR
ncbi:MAG: cytochrome c class [Gemmatimonadetes bacterium]|nr:cytochrome c class [Gemmatimonadota bacterium]